jgi:hypothetical protein
MLFYSPEASDGALPDRMVLMRSAKNPATRFTRVVPLSQPARTPFYLILRVIADPTGTGALSML